MNAEISRIGTAAADPDLVETCQILLAKAESGELRSLCYAGSVAGGAYVTGFSTTDAVEAAGLLTMTLHNLCASRRESDGGI